MDIFDYDDHEIEEASQFRFDPSEINKQVQDIMTAVNMQGYDQEDALFPNTYDSDEYQDILDEYDEEEESQELVQDSLNSYENDDLLMNDEFIFNIKRRRKGVHGRRPLQDYGLGSSGDEEPEYSQPRSRITTLKKKNTKRRIKKSTIPYLTKQQLKLMGQANQAYVIKNYDLAIDLYKQVIQEYPNSFEIYNTLALIEEERGDLRASLNYLLISAHLSSSSGNSNVDTWINLSRKASEFPNHSADKEAIYCYSKVLRYDKYNVEALWKRACISFRHFICTKRMVDTCSVILSIYPNEPFILRLLIHFYLCRNESLQAIQWLESFILTNPSINSFYPVRCLLRLYRHTGTYNRLIDGLPHLVLWMYQSNKQSCDSQYDFMNECPPDVLPKLLEHIHILRTPLDDIVDPQRILDPDIITIHHIDIINNENILPNIDINNPFFNPIEWFHFLPVDLRTISLIAIIHCFDSDKCIDILSSLFFDNDWIKNIIAPLGIELGKEMMSINKLDSSIVLFKKLLNHVDKDSDRITIFVFISYCLQQMNQDEEALKQLSIAADINPDNDDINLAFAELYAKTGQYELSKYYANRIISFRESSTDIHANDTIDISPIIIEAKKRRAFPKIIAENVTGRTSSSEFGPTRLVTFTWPFEKKPLFIRYTEQQCKQIRILYRKVNLGSEFSSIQELHETLGPLVVDFLNNGYFYRQSHHKMVPFSDRIRNSRPDDILDYTKDPEIFVIMKQLVSYDDSQSNTVSKQALLQASHGLSLEEWYDVIVKFSINAARLGHPNQSHYILFKAAHSNLFFSKEMFKLSLYFLITRIGNSYYSVSNSKAIAKVCRLLLIQYPKFGCSLIFVWLCLSRSSGHVQSVNDWMEISSGPNLKKFIREARRAEKDRDPYYIQKLVLVGHSHLMNRTWSDALHMYQRAIGKSNTPLLLLLESVCYLHQAMQRVSVNRQWQLIQAFHKMKKYAYQRKWNQEACYNMGRFFDHIGLSRFAIHYYEKGLEQDGILSFELAFNLSLVYSRNGNHLLASHYMNRYCDINSLLIDTQ